MNQEQQLVMDLFQCSLLKKEKYQQLESWVGRVDKRVCLEIGSNNGAVSYLLRQLGGHWHSADLESKMVESIRRMVGDRVCQIDGCHLPFDDGAIDLVVIVDFLEHIADDHGFLEEVKRVLKPSGRLLVNVPNLVKGSILDKIRPRLGLTDERHGHVRHGYSLEGLSEILRQHGFGVLKGHTYSGTFAESIDTLLGFLYLKKQQTKPAPPVTSAKGVVLDQADLQTLKKELKLYRLVYPLFFLVSRLDLLRGRQQGYKLIMEAQAPLVS